MTCIALTHRDLTVFQLSHNEKRQYVPNFLCREALSYYDAEIDPLGNIHGDVISEMKSQFILIMKQQCVKAELSLSSFQAIANKSYGDGRKSLHDLVAQFETLIPMCTRD